MVRNTVRWYAELPGLVSRGVLDDQAADRLRDHYGPVPQSNVAQRLLLMLFGVLGALLIGGGIALLLAHNWEELSRTARAAIAFALLLSGQAFAGVAALRRRNSMAWTEGAGVALAMSVITSLALISQTYHIGGPPESIFLHAAFLTIPAIYLLASRGVLALVWIETAAWLLTAPVLSLTHILQLFLVAAVTAPMAVRMHRRHRNDARTAIVGWVGAVCVFLCTLRLAADTWPNLWVPLLTGVMACLYGLGRLPADARLAGWRRPWEMAGALGTGGLLVVLSFPAVWSEVSGLPWRVPGVTASVVALLLAASLIGGAGVLALRRLRAGSAAQALLLGAPAVATLCWLFTPEVATGEQAAALILNGYSLATGLMFCIHGLRNGRLGIANGGLLLVMAILSTRFLDADWSFVARGIGFIVLGAAFLATNLWLVHARRRVEETT